MLRRLALRDFVIVQQLDVDLGPGFSVLTGETGAGKSILVDALQLALGARADALVVREGAARAEVSAEFDCPPALAAWLDEAGFAADAVAEWPAMAAARRAWCRRRFRSRSCGRSSPFPSSYSAWSRTCWRRM